MENLEVKNRFSFFPVEFPILAAGFSEREEGQAQGKFQAAQQEERWVIYILRNSVRSCPINLASSGNELCHLSQFSNNPFICQVFM